jgi:hypothetical protein
VIVGAVALVMTGTAAEDENPTPIELDEPSREPGRARDAGGHGRDRSAATASTAQRSHKRMARAGRPGALDRAGHSRTAASAPRGGPLRGVLDNDRDSAAAPIDDAGAAAPKHSGTRTPAVGGGGAADDSGPAPTVDDGGATPADGLDGDDSGGQASPGGRAQDDDAGDSGDDEDWASAAPSPPAAAPPPAATTAPDDDAGQTGSGGADDDAPDGD